MDPEGLSDEEMVETEGGLFTGWVWLRNYVFAKDGSMRGRVIILTAYWDQLARKLRSESPTHFLDGLSVIRKRQIGCAETGNIVDLVNVIATRLQEGTK
jgi:hypothetical protein